MAMYDGLMRLPLLGWVLLCAGTQLAGLSHSTDTRSMDFDYLIHAAMRLSTIAFLLLIAAVVILRTRPSAKASGLEPRISALLGTFLAYGIVLFPRCDLSLSAAVISTLLTMIGNVGAVVALSQLGRSFSTLSRRRDRDHWIIHTVRVGLHGSAIGRADRVSTAADAQRRVGPDRELP